MGSVLGNMFNPLSNLFKGNFRAVADPLKIAGDPDKKVDANGMPVEPDYLEAYQKGVDVDTATLAKRRQIDAAAQLGGVYYDGQVLTQKQFQDKLAFENQKLEAARASGDQTAIDQATTELGKLNTSNQFNFAGAGSAELAQQQLLQELAGADQTTRGLLDLQAKYGPEAARLARENLRNTDPTGFALREQYGNQLMGGGNSIESLFAAAQNDAPTYEQFNGREPRFGDVGFTNLQDTGEAKAGRADLEKQVFGELSQAGQADPFIQRAAEQAARARGAASGNILGDSSALQESLQVQLAQRGLDEKRRSEALGLLQSGQTTSDKGNELQQLQLQSDIASNGFNNDNRQQSFNNAMAAINQRNQATQNTFAGQNQLLQQRAGARQQDQANTQSFLGLQPVSAQAGGYQNVSAPFNPGNVQNGATTDPNAGLNGAQWYAQLFGAQNQLTSGQAQADAAKSAGNKQLIGAGAGVAAAAIIAI